VNKIHLLPMNCTVKKNSTVEHSARLGRYADELSLQLVSYESW